MVIEREIMRAIKPFAESAQCRGNIKTDRNVYDI